MEISTINIIGVIIMIVSVCLFRWGLEYKGVSGAGQYINNVKIVGGAVLLFILGFALSLSSKSACEVFGVLC